MVRFRDSQVQNPALERALEPALEGVPAGTSDPIGITKRVHQWARGAEGRAKPKSGTFRKRFAKRCRRGGTEKTLARVSRGGGRSATHSHSLLTMLNATSWPQLLCLRLSTGLRRARVKRRRAARNAPRTAGPRGNGSGRRPACPRRGAACTTGSCCDQ